VFAEDNKVQMGVDGDDSVSHRSIYDAALTALVLNESVRIGVFAT